jgi:Tol biopolymer transport system component
VSPPAEVVEFLIPPPETSRFTGTAPEFEISPDGRHVVFTAAFQGTPMLWIRSLTTSELRRLPGTEGAVLPFWRPDSQVIGFFADNQLKTIGLNSSAPVVLCATPLPGNTAGGTWNNSDVIVFSAGNQPIRQIRASDVGGKPSPATAFEKTDGAHRWPTFLPDGQHFLFLAQGSKPDELRVGSLTSDRPAVSLGPFQSHAVYADRHLVFVRGGSLVAQPFDPERLRLRGEPVMLAREAGVNPPWQHGSFSVSAAGHLAYTRTARAPSVLAWLDRQGGTVGTVGEPGVYFNLDLSPNERFVAISQLTQRPGAAPEFDIRVIDLARANAPTRVTDDPAWDFDPAWSPDGRMIVFNSNRPDPWKGQWGLFMRPMDGSGQDEPLTKQEGNTVSPDWSRDGRFIVYNRGIGGNSGLWVLQVKAGGPPAAFVNTQHNESNGAFSPDGRWIAYHSNASGRNEIYVKAFPAQPQAFPVSRGGGFSPRWRGDGKELFFLSLDGSMMAVDIDTTKEFVAGVPRKLFSTHLRPGNNKPYAVTKDGQRFLIPQIGEGSPITVVLNWNALLGNKRP